MDGARIESLHESASSCYLQGDLEGALSAWREVLEQDPADDRALEGIRLCEQLAGSESESVCTGRSPFAVGAAPSDEVPDRPAQVAPEAPRASGWRFGEVSQGSVPPPPETATPRPKPLTVSPAEKADAEASPKKPEGMAAAEAELRRRVNELIAETLRLVEGGEVAAAKRTIDRILILDEENETALSLRAKLGPDRGGTGAGESRRSAPVLFTAAHFGQPPPFEGPEEPGLADPPVDDTEPLSLAQPAGWTVAASAPGPPPPIPPPAFEAGSDDEGSSEPASTLLDDDLPPLDELIGEEPVAATSAPERRPAARSWPRPSPRTSAIAGGVLVLAAVAAWWLWPSGAPREQGGKSAAENASDGSAAASAPSELQPASAVATPAAEPTPDERFAAAISRADRAEAEGDAGQVVLALASALELRPDDAALRARLTAAAEHYRAGQELDKKWREALAAFEEQSYSQALAYFYRVPADDPRPGLERYKLNGWFNLGILALQSADCEGARQNLREARELSASDREVQAAFELAHRCGRAGDEGWARDASDLRLRSLDD